MNTHFVFLQGLKSPDIPEQKESPAPAETENFQPNQIPAPTVENHPDTTTVETYTSRCKVVKDFEEAPTHLKHNPFIRHGYRAQLSTKLCLESIFWWTNETVSRRSDWRGNFIGQ
jgi:hypothetical protein